MEWQVPTLADVLAARRRISPHLRPTPLFGYAGLDELLGAEVLVKHENHQPVGAFKVRGGVNLVSQLGAEERKRGVIAASTGNHGQSIAYAARLFGVPGDDLRTRASQPGQGCLHARSGRELVFHGRDFDDAARLRATRGRARLPLRALRQRAAADRGRRNGDARAPRGAAPDRRDRGPVGGGSGAAGACIVAKAINPAIKVIGVQSDAAPAAFRSWRGAVWSRTGWKARRGLATRTAFEAPQQILWRWLDDFVLVGDDEIRAAQALMIEATRNVEAAGAAPLAAGLRLRERLAGKRVALILSGGNASRERSWRR